MLKNISRISLLFLIIIPSIVFASDPSFYVKKETWDKTLWTSINALEKLEKTGASATGMPDFGGSNFTLMLWIKTSEDRSTIYGKVARESQQQDEQSKVLYIEKAC